MDMEIDEQQLKKWILDENKCITKLSIFRRCSMSHDEVESLFRKFYNNYKDGETRVYATFMYDGETDNNSDFPNMLSTLVGERNVEEAEKKFVKITSVTIYALNKEPANVRTLCMADWSREEMESLKPCSSTKSQPSKAPEVAEKMKKESPVKRKNAKKVAIKDTNMDDVFSTGAHEEEFSEPLKTLTLQEETKSEAENVVPVKRGRRDEPTTNEGGKVYKKVAENYVDEDGMIATRTVMKEIVVKEEEMREESKESKLVPKKVVKKPVKETKSKKVPSNQPKMTDFFTKQ
ncbi:hypothetical protein M3Y94_00774800 [Aphelenchoides besseyi]|nr:hypothetical protein M3Y94_00774800 [Aphelenchoides besseyi]KAI6232299.1 hypothetical protein M3Y95_00471600 [Aphelenchoides besseyi]